MPYAKIFFPFPFFACIEFDRLLYYSKYHTTLYTMSINYTDLTYLEKKDERFVYVLDTNVVLHDPASIFRFEEHVVLISFSVLEEIDDKKNDPGIGYNARDVSKKLEMLSSNASDETGIPIPNGKEGILLFLTGHVSKSIPKELDLSYRDNLMLAQVLGLKDSFYHRRFIFVTKDRNLRIKCLAMGIENEDYKHDKVSEEYLASFFKTTQEATLSSEEIKEIFTTKDRNKWNIPYRKKWKLRENEGIVLYDSASELFGLGIRKGDRLNYIDYHSIKILGMPPKVLDDKNYSFNFEQAICMQQAMDDDIKIQIIIGRAGTGKTHIAMAAALEKVFKEKRYDTIKLIKPIVTKSRLGEDIGFLPGSLRRKLIPKMRPFIEKLRQFSDEDFLATDSGYQKLLDTGIVELINLADVRGADLAGSIIIFDEAQNANPFQMRTLGTRLGENTKLIVLGDPTQIDSVYLDKYSNALINLYLNSINHPTEFLAQVCLMQMVRSHTSGWFEEVIQPDRIRT
jgi:PhoH-like ATPase